MTRTKAVNPILYLLRNKSKKRKVKVQARMLLAGRRGTTESPINNEITIKVNNVKTEDRIKIVGKSVRIRDNCNCIRTEYKTDKNIRLNLGVYCILKIIDKTIVTV